MGINPELFGPSFWGALHFACLGAEHPDKVRDFIALYPFVLPCYGCRKHFEEVLEENPVPETTDRWELFKWSVKVHNIVNVKLEKPELTVDEALYLLTRPKVVPEKYPRPMLWTLIAITLLFLIILLVKLKN